LHFGEEDEHTTIGRRCGRHGVSAPKDIDEKPLPHPSPMGWEHLNLTGDYIRRQNN
jgi:hypothetical protein